MIYTEGDSPAQWIAPPLLPITLFKDTAQGPKDGRTLVIVEVKTRRNRIFGDPEEAIDYRKRQNLQSAINHYVKSHRFYSQVRFDIISIVGTIGSQPEIDHIIDVALIWEE